MRFCNPIKREEQQSCLNNRTVWRTWKAIWMAENTNFAKTGISCNKGWQTMTFYVTHGYKSEALLTSYFFLNCIGWIHI